MEKKIDFESRKKNPKLILFMCFDYLFYYFSLSPFFLLFRGGFLSFCLCILRSSWHFNFSGKIKAVMVLENFCWLLITQSAFLISCLLNFLSFIYSFISYDIPFRSLSLCACWLLHFIFALIKSIFLSSQKGAFSPYFPWIWVRLLLSLFFFFQKSKIKSWMYFEWLIFFRLWYIYSMVIIAFEIIMFEKEKKGNENWI